MTQKVSKFLSEDFTNSRSHDYQRNSSFSAPAISNFFKKIMWNIFYRNYRLLILTILLILIWGISAFLTLPRMEEPQLSPRYALIKTFFPGSSAERVESLVSEPIEQELSQIAEIKTIASTSRLGSSAITLLLKDEVSDVKEAWSRVRDRLQDVIPELPQGVSEPDFEEIEARAYTKFVALEWNLAQPPNYTILNRLAKDLKQELADVFGTEKVEIFGSPQEEILVKVDSAKLAALNLNLQELSQQIKMSDAKVSAGQLRGDNKDLLLEVTTELDSLERVRKIPIECDLCSSELDTSGQFNRLGDIAVVSKGIREPKTEATIVNGKPGIVLAVLMNPSQRIDRWSVATNRTITEFADRRLFEGIGLKVLFDQSLYVKDTLTRLFQNLAIGIVCVIASTILLMGWRSAIVVVLSLPLSVLMVLGGMKLLDIPLHQISITGLVIALGLLIDNAIVVVDEVEQKLKKGVKPAKAIAATVKHLSVPLLASTLTTVLSFMPIILLQGSSGEFVRAIGLSVILSLLSSLFVSLTVIPALAGKFKIFNPTRKKESLLQKSWNSGFSHPKLTAIYISFLDKIFAKPLLGIALALILPLNGLIFASSLQQQFFPPAERDQFYVELELPPLTSIAQTESTVMAVRDKLLSRPEIINTQWFLGKNAPAFYYNLPRGRESSPNYAQGIIKVNSGEHSRQIIQSLQKELNQEFPSARILVRQLEQGPVISAPVEVRIYGSDLQTLRNLGKEVQAELTKLDNVIYTRANLTETIPKLAFLVDEERARLAGLDNTQIAQQLNAMLEGTTGGSILEATEELPVRVRVSNQQRANLNEILSLQLSARQSPNSDSLASVSLSDLGQIQLVPEESTIVRRNGRRMNRVQAFISAGILPATVVKDFKNLLERDRFEVPSGYILEFGGEQAARDNAIERLMSTVWILLGIMTAILVLSFGSFRAAFIIGVVGFSAIGLGLLPLWLFGYPFGFMAILGTIGLVGVAINDSIVILAALRADPKARMGDRRAVRKVIVYSTRHVLTTTLTTVAGFIPLWIDGGATWPPLAVAIAGGVGGATFLAICLVPCAHLLLIKYGLKQKGGDSYVVTKSPIAQRISKRSL